MRKPMETCPKSGALVSEIKQALLKNMLWLTWSACVSKELWKDIWICQLDGGDKKYIQNFAWTSPGKHLFWILRDCWIILKWAWSGDFWNLKFAFSHHTHYFLNIALCITLPSMHHVKLCGPERWFGCTGNEKNLPRLLCCPPHSIVTVLTDSSQP
jgi:hypothetical protein